MRTITIGLLCLALGACESVKPIPPYTPHTEGAEQQSPAPTDSKPSYFSDAPWYFWVGASVITSAMIYGWARGHGTNEVGGNGSSAGGCKAVPTGWPGATNCSMSSYFSVSGCCL